MEGGLGHRTAHLITAVSTVKQFLTYTSGAPFQIAIARALTEGRADVSALREGLQRRRDLLVAGLREVGFGAVVPEGTYFVCADASPFLTPQLPDGAALARALPRLAGVAGVPISAFCVPGSDTADALGSWLRFTFVKREDVLAEGIERLGRLTG